MYKHKFSINFLTIHFECLKLNIHSVLYLTKNPYPEHTDKSYDFIRKWSRLEHSRKQGIQWPLGKEKMLTTIDQQENVRKTAVRQCCILTPGTEMTDRQCQGRRCQREGNVPLL